MPPTTSSSTEDSSESQKPSFWKSIWQNNKGALLILFAEIFGSTMDAEARFLQVGQLSMHPFQVIFFRMGITFLLCNIYMYFTNVPDYPFGDPSIRGWLLLRAAFGYGGLFCLYYSVHYLPLAEATVLRFLVPIFTSLACALFLGLPFTRKEFAAGLIALIGVTIIAHPSFIFGHAAKDDELDNVTHAQRLFAIFIALIGVFGAAGAYTTIRVIGNKAHALMSVNYFAFLATLCSGLALTFVPGLSWTVPQGVEEWALLLSLGVLGFFLQFLLTAGLQLDRTSKATSMLYLQILMALAFDFVIWGVVPGKWSVAGGVVVIASTLWSALQKPQKVEEKSRSVDEESALLGGEVEGSEEVSRRASVTV